MTANFHQVLPEPFTVSNSPHSTLVVRMSFHLVYGGGFSNCADPRVPIPSLLTMPGRCWGWEQGVEKSPLDWMQASQPRLENWMMRLIIGTGPEIGGFLNAMLGFRILSYRPFSEWGLWVLCMRTGLSL